MTTKLKLSAIDYFRRSLVNFRLVLLFGVPSTIGVYMTRKYLVPAIPDQMFDFDELLLTKDIFLMLLLAVLIFISAIIMITVKRKYKTEGSNKTSNLYLPWLIMVEGLLIGLLTGTVGIGGGFMIIPALVLLCKQPIKIAIGSSLFITVIQSGFGFLGEWGNNLDIDYFLIARFTGFTISGVAIGMLVSRKVSGYKLRNAFGYILLAIGVFIVIAELLKMQGLHPV